MAVTRSDSGGGPAADDPHGFQDALFETDETPGAADEAQGAAEVPADSDGAVEIGLPRSDRLRRGRDYLSPA